VQTRDALLMVAAGGFVAEIVSPPWRYDVGFGLEPAAVRPRRQPPLPTERPVSVPPHGRLGPCNAAERRHSESSSAKACFGVWCTQSRALSARRHLFEAIRAVAQRGSGDSRFFARCKQQNQLFG